MPTRQDLQKRIAEIESQVNTELARTRLPDLDSRRRAFPKADWVLALLLLGWHYFGGSIPAVSEFHGTLSPYDLYLGIAVGILAVLRTVRWVFKGSNKTDANYMEATSKVRDLQAQKRELQAQIKELGD